MTDKRWQELGDLLINYSLAVKPGEKLMIAMYEVESYPLALAAYSACIKAGGYPQVQFMSEALKHRVLRYGNEEQISWVPEIESYGMEWADCYLALRGAFNLNECYDIPADKIAKYQKAMGVISGMRWELTRWALVRVPNERFAQQANVNYEKIMDLFFDACLKIDWKKEQLEYRRLADILDEGNEMRILGYDTDLSISYGGNKWHIENGLCNIPDGEIYVTPKWETVNGHIYFEFPATIGGKVINGLRLHFQDGIAVEATSDNNQDYLNKILDTDDCSRRIGELAFGTNPFIDICTTDILIDEKMGGTMHIAMGRPYDGSYYSALHWDIVKDTRTRTKVYLDGNLIFEDGKFFI